MSMTLTWPLGASPTFMDPSAVRRIKYPKSPTDLSPVTGDFSGALAAIDNDTLAPTFTPQTTVLRNDGGAADLYVVGIPSISPDRTRVTVWLAAGSAGYEYLISITVQSADEQILTRSFIIPVYVR